MVNVAKLKDAMKKRNRTVENVCNAIGINPSTFYRKLISDGENFTIGEVDAIVKYLQLSAEEATEIFFAQFVA